MGGELETSISALCGSLAGVLHHADSSRAPRRRRLPAPHPPRSVAIKDHAMASHKLVTESTLKPTGFTETDDEETAAIRTVIDAAEINWGGSLSGGGHAGGRFGSHFGNRPLEGEAPPPGYVCRICHIPGHFIQHCPSKSKPPPPGYICHKCGVPGHFIQCCPNYGDRKYDSGRTCSLIPVVYTQNMCTSFNKYKNALFANKSRCFGRAEMLNITNNTHSSSLILH